MKSAYTPRTLPVPAGDLQATYGAANAVDPAQALAEKQASPAPPLRNLYAILTPAGESLAETCRSIP